MIRGVDVIPPEVPQPVLTAILQKAREDCNACVARPDVWPAMCQAAWDLAFAAGHLAKAVHSRGHIVAVATPTGVVTMLEWLPDGVERRFEE